MRRGIHLYHEHIFAFVVDMKTKESVWYDCWPRMTGRCHKQRFRWPRRVFLWPVEKSPTANSAYFGLTGVTAAASEGNCALVNDLWMFVHFYSLVILCTYRHCSWLFIKWIISDTRKLVHSLQSQRQIILSSKSSYHELANKISNICQNFGAYPSH